MFHRSQTFRSVQSKRLNHTVSAVPGRAEPNCFSEIKTYVHSLLKAVLTDWEKKVFSLALALCGMTKMVDLFLTHRKSVKAQSVLRDNSKDLALRYAFDLFIILPNTDRPPLLSVLGLQSCNGEYNFVTTHCISIWMSKVLWFTYYSWGK